MPLNITILGAGISGLVAALALRQQQHHVTILEKTKDHQETGAAIHLGPNCSGLLIRLGFDPDKVDANLFMGMAQYDSRGSKEGVKMRLDLKQLNKQWSNPWLCVHRKDLHRELRRMVLDASRDGPVPQLELGCQVVDIDAEVGQVMLENGRVLQSDVVIGADGHFSFARKQIQPYIKPFAWGKTVYRWLVPRELLLKDAETRELIGEEGWFSEISEGDRRVVMYPCRGNTEMNFVAFIPNEEAGELGSGEYKCLHIVLVLAESLSEWNQEGNKSILLEAFENFSSDTRKLLSHAPSIVRAWRLYDMQTLDDWTEGRLALIGDAAHPFLPFLGQGGAAAIEDSISISQVLPEGTAPEEVPERLELYQDIRQERVSWIQEQTRINGLDEDKRPAGEPSSRPKDNDFTFLEAKSAAQ